MKAVLMTGFLVGSLAAAGVPGAAAQTSHPRDHLSGPTIALQDTHVVQAQVRADSASRPVGPLESALVLGIQPVDRLARDAPMRPFAQDTVLVRRQQQGPFLLMIVGATGMLAGLLTDSDALAIGSAAIFGVGVYLYIR